MTKNHMTEIRRRLIRQGHTATKTEGGHWEFEHPDISGLLYLSNTAVDHRASKNMLAMIKHKTINRKVI